MLRRLLDLDTRLHARIEAMMARHGVLYPWWIPVVCVSGQLLCVAIALTQRGAWWPVDPVVWALPLVLLVPLLHFAAGLWLPWWIDGIGTFSAATLLMLHPLESGVDLAPALLAFLAAEAVARDGVLRGGTIGLASAGLVATVAATVGLSEWGVYLLEVLLGAVVGAMLWWQMRALAAERLARSEAWERATTAERERIAREIHDLIAHSLSVSLLQITGARHALADLREVHEEDPAEAERTMAEVDAALADAEAVGRGAMAEIRRTVAAVATGPAASPDVRQALPGASDIEALVAQTRAAGLAIDYTAEGDPSGLPDGVGLGLYRIVQESLANVARHGAGGGAQVEFRVRGAGVLARITNPLPEPRTQADGLGSGLAGMQARATQIGARLSAGPVGRTWQVEVRLDARAPRAGWLDLGCGRTAPAPAVVSAGPTAPATSAGA